MGIKKIFLLTILFFTTSCVSTNFESYKSLDNLKKDKNYFEVSESQSKKNYVEIGVHTIYNRENIYSIYVSFKNKLLEPVEIESYRFGKIPQSAEDDKVYLKRIEYRRPQNDTILIKFSGNKIYKFCNEKSQ
ncbi:hypothetical protein AAEU33_03180 [Chryseobacterium sp. Chry.R1]|uniref:hypothetical protein n=1 Tax=Chryseobacterium sp. Chry.R1 TaxID=3139392 RepID=UPI0031F78635